jgi:sarcosine oxidase subunit gamma
MSDPVSVLDRAERTLRPGLTIADLGVVPQVTLRCAHDEPALAAAVHAVAGVALPAPLRATVAEDGRAAVWMSPDELLLFPGAPAPEAVAALDAALDGVHALAVDVSHARTVLRLTGPDVAETLAKGSPVDLSDAGFPVGCARRTHLGQVAVGIVRREAEVWDLVSFRSQGQFVFDWLTVAGAEGAEVGRF